MSSAVQQINSNLLLSSGLLQQSNNLQQGLNSAYVVSAHESVSGEKIADFQEESIGDLFSSMNFGPGLALSFQEFMYVFIPKTVSSIAIRHSWLMAVYEFLLDFPETIGMYVVSPIIASIFALWSSKQLKIPSFKLMGEPMWKLKNKLHMTHEIGGKKFRINEELLSKVAFGKLASFAVGAGAIVVAQIMAALPRVFLAKELFHTNNFYAISGLYVKPEDLEDSSDAQHAVKNARKNFWSSFVYLIASIPLMMGAVSLLGRHVAKTKPKWIEKLSTHIDLGPNFSLSKALALTGLAAAPYAYMSVALNKAERLENRDRLLFLSIPEVLFFKQLAGNILSWITGIVMGAGNVWMPLSKWKKQVKEGKREFLDLSLIDNNHIKQLTKVKEMKPEKQERLIKNINLMNHWVVYAAACAAGFLVNWLNFLRTEKMDEEDEGATPQSNNLDVAKQANPFHASQPA